MFEPRQMIRLAPDRCGAGKVQVEDGAVPRIQAAPSQAQLQRVGRRPGLGKILLAFACWLTCEGGGAVGADSPVERGEYEVKAAFLYSFTKFVEWPAAAFAEARSPIVIGVFERNPFGPELERTVQGRRVNERPFIVKVVNTVEEAKAVQVLFVAADVSKARPGLLRELAGAPVLTVGETPEFARLGGIIAFLLRGDKVHFQINIAAARQAGIRISAQVQKLALPMPK